MILTVAVGVMVNNQNQVLIAQRPKGKLGEGCWEFPGGKVESGETIREALDREMKEELGIDVVLAEPLFAHVNTFPDRTVNLHIWKVSGWQGSPIGLEGQQFQWESLDGLELVDFLPGNKLMLPRLKQCLSN